MSKEIWRYVTNAIVGMCLGGIIDYFAGTRFICALVGIIAGIVITLFIKN